MEYVCTYKRHLLTERQNVLSVSRSHNQILRPWQPIGALVMFFVVMTILMLQSQIIHFYVQQRSFYC